MLSQADKEFVEKYNVMIDVPAVTDKEADVFLIRHGFSNFNLKHLVIKSESGHYDAHSDAFRELKGDLSVIDANLSDIGVH